MDALTIAVPTANDWL